MKRIIIFITIIFIHLSTIIVAQDKPNIVKTKGEGLVEWHQDMESRTDAQNRAEEIATVNALENVFGTAVIQGNTTYLENKNTGEKVETNTTFNMIGNTIVKGEVLNVEKIEFNETKETDKINRKKITKTYIICNIQLLAKEITDTKLDIKTFSLSKNMKNYNTTSFYSDDELYLYFKSPQDGYITAFIDNNKTAERILPYEGMPSSFDNGMEVKADEEYIFFSTAKEHNYFSSINFEPYEIVLVPDEDRELNRIFIIFSKEPLNKPSLKKDLNLTKEDIEKNYTVPKGMASEDFQHWLIKNQQMRTDMQIENILITIDKK